MRQKSASAMLAAAKAAKATGGVTMDSMPKYITNRCACMGAMPACTRAGAASVAMIT